MHLGAYHTLPRTTSRQGDNYLGDLAKDALHAHLRWLGVAAGVKTGLEYECNGQGRTTGYLPRILFGIFS
jgi:hypothetical protein